MKARPMPEDFAQVAPGKTITWLRGHYNAGEAPVTRWLKQLQIKPERMVLQRVSRPVPDDFAQFAPHEGDIELSCRYTASTSTIRNWREKTGLVRTTVLTHDRRPLPDDFAEMAGRLTRAELRRHYGAGFSVLERWIAESGVTPHVYTAEQRRARLEAAARANNRRALAGAVDRIQRDMTHVGQAVDFLRKFGPISRCFATGKLDPKGDHWRRGSTVLTAAEVIERAERLGFDPDAWKRIGSLAA